MTLQSQSGTHTTTDKASIQKEISQLLQSIDKLSKTTTYNGISILNKDLGISFDGTNGRIEIGVSPSLHNEDVINSFTYEFWVKPMEEHEIDPQSNTLTSGTSGQKYAIWAGYGLHTDYAGVGVSVGTNGISVYEHASSYMPAMLVYENAIHDMTHVAVVYENKTPSLYINGNFVKSGETSTRIPTISSRFGGGSYGHIDGFMKDIRIWDHARTEQEIKDNMHQSLTGNESGLYTNLSLDARTGNVVSDITGNNHGTLLGSYQWANTGNPSFIKIHTESGYNDSLNFELFQTSTNFLGLENYQVTSTDSLVKVDRAIDTILSQRSRIGSLLRRLEIKEDNLQNSKTNTELTQQRIQDADFANETSMLAKNRIKTESIYTIMTKNNSIRQSILELIRN